jgi:23S rRNA (adenine2503-C2)-methyltransferase
MQDLKGMEIRELMANCSEHAIAAYKAKEIFRALHKQHKEEIGQLTFLSLAERELLAKKYIISRIDAAKEKKTRQVVKVLFQLPDGKAVETVLMQYGHEQSTLCLSSQVGCPVRCQFCATGKMGFKRNLTAGEILSQVYYFAKKGRISNIVFMGMGEPFLNYDNVLKAARILNHPLGEEIAARKIVFSTVGIINGIKKLAAEKEQFRLAWSLVSPFDEVRKKLITLRSLGSVAQTLDAIKDYQKRTERRVTIEYVVMEDVNDRPKDTDALIDIAQLLDCHINLIPFNPSLGTDFLPGNVPILFSRLKNAGINVTVRKSFGAEINAACGQLALR